MHLLYVPYVPKNLDNLVEKANDHVSTIVNNTLCFYSFDYYLASISLDSFQQHERENNQLSLAR